MQDVSPRPATSGLDTAIKVLTILKLLLQLAFYGLLVGGTIWFLLKNPLPEIIKGVQEQALRSFMQGGN